MIDRNWRFFILCLALAGCSLVVSFGLRRQPLWMLPVLLPVGGMLSAHRSTYAWLANFSLAGFAALSAVGLQMGTPLLPNILAAVAALAAWDLLLEDLQAASGGEPVGNRRYEKLHLNSLVLALGAGLVGAGAGAWIHWRAPFVISLALVLLALYCVDRALAYATR